MGSSFRKYKFRSYLIYQPTVIDQKRYIKHRLMKINKQHYIAILLEHKRAWSWLRVFTIDLKTS